jgi:hypothetical protein
MKRSIANYSNSTMTLALLAIFVVMVAVSSRYPAGARFMTFVVGLPAIALCLLQLTLDARDRARASNGGRGPSELEIAQRQVSQKVGHAVHFDVAQTGLGNGEPALDPRTKVLRELTVWSYFLALIAGILLFGFHLAVPVFLLAFLRFYAKAKWTTAVSLTAMASLVIYFAFEKVLRMPLHPGLLSDQIGWILPF